MFVPQCIFAIIVIAAVTKDAAAQAGLGGLLPSPSAPVAAPPTPIETPPADRKIVDKMAKSVVQITMPIASYSFKTPWRRNPEWGSAGSGFIIPGKLIMTNAHVAADTNLILVKKKGIGQRFIAKRFATSVEADLALLTVDDEEFWEGMVPLQFAKEMPDVGEEMWLLGFPKGWKDISVTIGRVGGFDLSSPAGGGQMRYESGYNAVGPFFEHVKFAGYVIGGNSGGPFLNADREICAVVDSGLFKLITPGMAYGVGLSAVQYFMHDVKVHGSNTAGRPFIEAQFSEMSRNPMAMKYFGLSKFEEKPAYLPKGVSAEGAFVENVDQSWIDEMRRLHGAEIPPEKIGLQTNDILLSLNGKDIGFDNKISYRERSRILWSMAIEGRFPGEMVDATVLRDRELLDIKVPLSPNNRTVVARSERDLKPRYFVYGGLHFQALTFSVASFSYDALDYFIHRRFKKACFATEDGSSDEDIVVLIQTLGTKFTLGYEAGMILRTVDGVKVRSVRHLINLVENPKDPSMEIVTFGYKDGTVQLMNRTEVAAGTDEILQSYSIGYDRSAEYRHVK